MQWYKWAILVCLVVGTILYVAPRPSFVPEVLWGRWVTDVERYADRHIDISESVLAFGQGGVKIRVMTIERVEKKTKAAGGQYILHYRDEEGDRQRLHLLYTPKDGGQLQITSQREIVWYRFTSEKSD